MPFELSAFQKEVLSGLTTGALTTIVVHPLDLVKVRLQLLSTSNYKQGYFDVIRSIVNNPQIPKGSSNLIKEAYRGLGINLIGNTLAWGLYFGLYRKSKDTIYNHYYSEALTKYDQTHTLISHDQKMTSLMYLSAGGMSGLVTSILTNPIWVIKTRMMSTSRHISGSYSSSIDGFKRLLRQEGVKSLWKGLVPSLFGVSQGAIYFMVYDTLKYKYSSMRKQNNDNNVHDKLKSSETIFITSLSKMISVTTVYPFQLLKSNLQSFAATDNKFTLINLTKGIYHSQGLLGLYKGLYANLIRAIPSTCITFCIYENFRHWV